LSLSGCFWSKFRYTDLDQSALVFQHAVTLFVADLFTLVTWGLLLLTNT